MNPIVVQAAGALFLACLAVHIALWRWAGVRRIPVLFAVFFGPVILALSGAALAPPGALAWPELLGVLLGHAALSCAYIQTYPTLTPRLPPTLRLTMLVWSSRSRGATFEELETRINSRALIREIFDPLLVGRLLVPGDSGRLIIGARGRALIWPFVLLRRVLGLPRGEG